MMPIWPGSLHRSCAPGCFALGLVLLAGCAAPQPQDEAGSKAVARPNVIIVMVDTLRADHMSLYGHERLTTPFIDTFVSEAVVFERARSQAACTFPSVNSLLTSRSAFVYYQLEEGLMGIPSDIPSMAEILKDQGYSTGAVSGSPIVRNTPSENNPEGGFGRGFDIFDEQCLWMDASCVNARVKVVLEQLEEPFLLYVHYMDPHGHYAPPPSHERQFAGQYDGFDFIAAGDSNPIGTMLYDNGEKFDIGDSDIEHLLDLYDDEILYFDREFGKLIDGLRSGGLLDRSALVFTSDHGEEFLEHNHVGHCRGVWDTLTWVPLFMRLPGAEAGGARRQGAVQLIDILPTVVDWVGGDEQGFEFEGVSLQARLLGDDETEYRYAFTDQSFYRAVDDGTFQLVLDAKAMKPSLYDLRVDPNEQVDIFTPSNPEFERLSQQLNQWLRDTGQWVRLDDALAAAKFKEEELRALGYLQ